MKFKDTELLPGVVVDCNDPKKLGRVRATVPGLFDDSEMDINGMPWIYPITMTGYQGFSKLINGSKIWVFKQEENYKEFWYMPMFEMNGNTRDTILSDYNEPEVLISRSAGDQSVYIYYTDKQGIVIKYGTAGITINSNGEIIMKSNGGQVSISGGKVYMGNSEATEQAILGNSLNKTLNNLVNDLQKLAEEALKTPYTAKLTQPIIDTANNLQNGIGKKILCDNTVVS